ncbi:MAG: hypothetical protein ACRC8C_02035 [Mycoplasmoidaceae bacterium]
MNRQKNFIFKSLILILFLLSLIISFYFSIDWILKNEFTNNVILEINDNQTFRAVEILNVTSVNWWIIVISLLFGSLLLFIIFLFVIITLRVKDKKRLFFFNKNNEETYSDQLLRNNISIRTDTYILEESDYTNNVSYRTKEFVPYYSHLHDDYLRNNWWMRKE